MIPPKKSVARIARRLARSDDGGAALLMALIFVTVIAVVIATILSFVDVSMRNTIAVRAEAAQAATADGAAQVAINGMRNSTYAGATGNCFGTSATLPLPAFYTPAAGSGYSAAVTCERDTTNSASSSGVAINGGNKPGNAILTLGTSTDEDGLRLMANGSKNTVQVHGSVFSHSNITVDRLTTNAAVIARGTCTGTITSVPAKACNIGGAPNPAGKDPDYPAPTASTAVQPVPACDGNKVVRFTPGQYTDLTKLNQLTNGCDATFYFRPGTYYFNFSGVWTLRSGYLVGGTPMPGQVADGKVPDMPGSCQTPVPPDPVPAGGWINPGPDAGVQFVFGGDSQLVLNKGSMEICGSYSTTSPPVAVYGLKTAVGGVPAESGCITTIGHGGCSVISSDNSPRSELYIQGTTYVPLAAVDIQLNNATGQVFRYGIIARHLSVSATGSADLSGPIIEVPDDAPGGGVRTVVYLKVYVCTGPTACATTSNPALKVKVGIEDPTATPVAGARQVTVYSWSVQR